MRELALLTSFLEFSSDHARLKFNIQKGYLLKNLSILVL